MEEVKRVAFYLRVSTTEQAEEGNSLKFQKNNLLDLVNLNSKFRGWKTNEKWHYCDAGLSGKDLNRKEYKRMMEDARKGEFDIILVWKIDRMARNLSHLLKTFEDLKKCNVSFYSLKENIDFSGAIGKLTFQIFGALAEFERETIVARSAEGRLQAAREGRYTGGSIPYGFESKKVGKGSVLVKVDSEAKQLKQIYDWFVYERLNYEQIARRLTELKIPKGKAAKAKKDSAPWSAYAVQRILTRATSIGQYKQNIKDSEGEVKEVVTAIDPIIDEVTYYMAINIADEITETKGKRGGGKNNYLLSRKIIDPETGRKFVGYPRPKGGYGYRRKSFVCSQTNAKYKNLEVPAKPLEDFVWDLILKAIYKPEEFYQLYQKQDEGNVSLNEINQKISEHENALTELEAKRFSINDDFFSGGISEEERDKHQESITKQIDFAEGQMSKLDKEARSLAKSQHSEAALKQFSQNYEKWLSNITEAQKQILIDICVDRIEVLDSAEAMNVKVYFGFAQPIEKQANTEDEPKNGLNKTKKDSFTNESQLDGAEGGNRTHTPCGTRF